MKRTAHIVSRHLSGVMPTIIIIVQAAIRQFFESDADATGHQILAGWHAVVMTRNGEAWKSDAHVNDDSRDRFWQFLTQHVQPEGKTWVMSMHAREQLAILGLWDKIADSTARVAGVDPKAAERETSGSGGLSQGYVILEGPPTCVKFSLNAKPGTIIWVDPANYGAKSLWDDCKASLADQFAANITEPEPWLSATTLPTQVEHVEDWLASYLRAIDLLKLGPLEQTAASQAMSGYRRTYMQEPITVHDSIPILDLERQALYGGRCEARFIGTIYGDGTAAPTLDDIDVPQGWTTTEGRIFHLDVNSLYASVARDAMLPSQLLAVQKFVDPTLLLQACTCGPVVARVYVEVGQPVVPVISDDGIIYPTGRFWTTLAGPELQLASQYGSILKCTTMAWYAGRPLYRRWVDEVFGSRLAALDRGDRAISGCMKSLLTASFGKWAQRSKRWEPQPGAICPYPFFQWWKLNRKTNETEQWRSFAWAVERLVDAGETPESFPAITATIHSLARVRLWRLAMQAGMNNVFYYDTDSLWVNHRGYEALDALGEIHATALGKMKRVAVHQQVTIWGQKRYRADGKLTIAGADAATVKTGDVFALQLKAPPTSHYLTQRQAPGTDRHVSRVRINMPYLVGKVLATGATTPHILIDDGPDIPYTGVRGGRSKRSQQ